METVVNSDAQVEQNAPTEFNDLKEGMEIVATIKKIVNFGAFADIGVGVEGLIHISKMANKFVSNPGDIVEVGEQVKVKVISIDHAKKRISLSMRDEDEASNNNRFSKKRY